MGNLLTKPQIKPYNKSEKEFGVLWRQIRSIYGNISAQDLTHRFASVANLNTNTSRTRTEESLRQNGIF